MLDEIEERVARRRGSGLTPDEIRDQVLVEMLRTREVTRDEFWKIRTLIEQVIRFGGHRVLCSQCGRWLYRSGHGWSDVADGTDTLGSGQICLTGPDLTHTPEETP